MSGRPEPLDRQVFETQRLVVEHPPVWSHRNKRLVYEIACPPGCTHRGQLVYSRWRAMPLPEVVNARAAATRTEGREDVYDYVPPDDLKHSAAVVAALVYQAAMRDQLLPRKGSDAR